MQVLKVCGFNDKSGIKPGSSTIYPPAELDFETSSILSYYAYNSKTIIITKDGVAHGIGDNSKCEISGSLPKGKISTFTDIDLRDNNNEPCSAISAVCGETYTLYMILTKKGEKKLAYSRKDLNAKYPVILDTDGYVPVALFGGSLCCAAIDSDGGILYINHYFYNSPRQKVKRYTLPGNEKAVSVACCYEFVISIGSNNQIFKSNFDSELLFKEVPELKDEKILCITGISCHAFAVTND